MKDIVKEAEAIILSLEKNRKNEFALRTNQLRKFLSAVNTVSNKVNVYQAQIMSANPSRMSKDLVLSEQLAAEIKYLKGELSS